MKRILVTDDDPEIRELLQLVLKDVGYDAVFTDGGEAGLNAYAQCRNDPCAFDLLIFDLAMPYTNGFEAASKIRELGDTKTPILFMTGFDEKDESIRTDAKKITPYPICYKPFEIIKLVEQIHLILLQNHTDEH